MGCLSNLLKPRSLDHDDSLWMMLNLAQIIKETNFFKKPHALKLEYLTHTIILIMHLVSSMGSGKSEKDAYAKPINTRQTSLRQNQQALLQNQQTFCNTNNHRYKRTVMHWINDGWQAKRHQEKLYPEEIATWRKHTFVLQGTFYGRIQHFYRGRKEWSEGYLGLPPVE